MVDRIAVQTRSTSLVILLMASVGMAGAKSPPLPAPDPARGAIAVTVRGRFPLGQKGPAVQVYFVRLGDDVDMFAAEFVVPSDFSKKTQVYLLNAKPGRYVAVAAELRGLGTVPGDFVVFFDRAMIPRTEVEVVAGEVVFMGDWLVDLKTKMREADETQNHYLRLVEPDAARKGFHGRTFSREYMYRGELVETDVTAATEAAFWKLARDKIFEDEPGWRALVANKLAAAGQR